MIASRVFTQISRESLQNATQRTDHTPCILVFIAASGGIQTCCLYYRDCSIIDNLATHTMKSTKVQTLGAVAHVRGFEKPHALTRESIRKAAKQKMETHMAVVAERLVACCLTIPGSL